MAKADRDGGKDGPKAKRVLVVCSGNVCRSPMAEYMLRKRLGRDSEWEVVSAGVSAMRGMAPSAYGVEVLGQRGIDITRHESQPLTRELVDSASVIVVMTASHRQQIRALYPQAREKIFLLRSFDPRSGSADVEDPVGMTMGTYEKVYAEMDAAMPELVSFLEGLHVRKR